jgi:hypothetical protein
LSDVKALSITVDWYYVMLEAVWIMVFR